MIRGERAELERQGKTLGDVDASAAAAYVGPEASAVLRGSMTVKTVRPAADSATTSPP